MIVFNYLAPMNVDAPRAAFARADAIQFRALAPRVPVRTEVIEFPLRSANEALSALRQGKLSGAAVLIP